MAPFAVDRVTAVIDENYTTGGINLTTPLGTALPGRTIVAGWVSANAVTYCAHFDAANKKLLLQEVAGGVLAEEGNGNAIDKTFELTIFSL